MNERIILMIIRPIPPQRHRASNSLLAKQYDNELYSCIKEALMLGGMK